MKYIPTIIGRGIEDKSEAGDGGSGFVDGGTTFIGDGGSVGISGTQEF